jgi:predicted TIM-barrel fold metal-dependent hydrolase
MHVLEPPDLWQRYMEPGLKDRAPVGMTEWPMDLRVRLGDRVNPPHQGTGIQTQIDIITSQLGNYAQDLERGFDPQAQVLAMDREGIDETVLFPSRGLYAHSFSDLDSELSTAISRAYNDWLSDFCKEGDTPRMMGAGMLPIHDVDMSVEEARRCVKDLGFKAMFLRPNPVREGEYWDHPKYNPLWREVQDLDTTLGFHEGMNSYQPTVGHDRWERGGHYAIKHAVSHPMEQMMALASFTLGGILEKFPQMRVGFLEGNGSWLPFWLWRLDEHLEWAGKLEHQDLSAKPSDYFFRQCLVSVECEETPAKYAIDAVGNDHFVFSTDYPHPDAKFPGSTQYFLDNMPISDESKRKILWDNCRRLYGL